MAERPAILVTGSTGNVGRQVISQLVDAGIAVRAMARNPDSADLPNDVEVVRGDFSDPSTLDSCLDGIDAVFLVWPFLTTEAAPPVLDMIAHHANGEPAGPAHGHHGGTHGEATAHIPAVGERPR
jgi:uncharacterized protein YbjT (DUF2867 family)